MTEREKQEQFMFLLLQLATRRERQILQDHRPAFLNAMRELRRLVQRMAPTGEFRQYEWAQLRREVPRLINAMVVDFTNTLMPELVALEAPVQEFGQDYADVETPSFTPQTEQQLLESVFIDSAKLPLAAYLIFNGRLARDLENQLNRVVDIGLLRGDSTQKISNDILRLTVRDGKLVPVVRTGSFANRALTQVQNTMDGAVWGTINQNLKIAWEASAPVRWQWNAVLDSRTCPVCAKLDKKIVPKPPTFVSTGYSRTMPPVHPRCRCVILPVFT